jgi:hypothetical protein
MRTEEFTALTLPELVRQIEKLEKELGTITSLAACKRTDGLWHVIVEWQNEH